MKKTLLILLTSFVFTVSSFAFSASFPGEIIIDPKFYHIGDSYMFGYLIPEPSGLSWEDSFRLKNQHLRKDYAFLGFLSHSNAVRIYINGNQITTVADDLDELDLDLSLENGASSRFFQYIISIPLEYLSLGKNTITFSARQLESGYDDGEFGKIKIWFQRETR